MGTLAQYKIIDQIGCGSFGNAYRAIDTANNNREVAIKVEKIDIKHKQLRHEFRVYQDLGSHPHIPQVYSFKEDKDEKQPSVLSMCLLGENLEHRFYRAQYNISLSLLLSVTIQLLSVIQHVHSKGYIHRDIKPENVIFGRGRNAHKIYLVDFGLSCSFIDKRTQQHVALRITNNGVTGTDRFVGVNAHFGHNQSRRDDLESIGFMFVYLAKGKLPWQSVAGSSRRRQRMISSLKIDVETPRLCENLDSEIANYIEYCRSLKFDEDPDYDRCRSFFIKIGERYNIDTRNETHIVDTNNPSRRPQSRMSTLSIRNNNNNNNNNNNSKQNTIAPTPANVNLRPSTSAVKINYRYDPGYVNP